MKYLVIIQLITFAIAKKWDENCGGNLYEDAGAEQSDQKIVGGWDARMYEFPWQVSLMNEGGSHFCGGSIITSRHVITAAHCIGKLNITAPVPSDMQIEIGKWKRINEGDNPHRRRVQLSAITNHPNYNPITSENDICVLELAEELDFSASEMAYLPICRPESSNDFVGSLATVSGWGTTQSGNILLPNVLQYTNLDVISNDECSGCNMPNIVEGSVCAGNCGPNQDDSCQGDSGGPMALKNADGLWELIGVVSWGYGCASLRPGVYARVTYFNDWIDGIVGTV